MADRSEGPVHLIRQSRLGLTLIELIAALLGSVVLMISMAGIIRVSSVMLGELAEEDREEIESNLGRLIADDLRFAGQIEMANDQVLRLERLGVDGLPQPIFYQIGGTQVGRQVRSGPLVQVLDQQPAIEHLVSIANQLAESTDVASSDAMSRIHAVTQSTSTNAFSPLVIDTPPGCQPGDWMLLCVGAGAGATLSLDHGSWTSAITQENSRSSLFVQHLVYSDGWPDQTTVESSVNSRMTGLLIAIRGTEELPITWSNSFSGQTPTPDGPPQASDSSATLPDQLTFQVLLGQGSPFESSLGIPSYVDVGIAAITTGPPSERHTLGVAARHGSPPILDMPLEAIYTEPGQYLQFGFAIRNAP